MQSTIKRCTLAIIMCGLSAIGMAQEKLIDEDFTDLTVPPTTWTTSYCTILTKLGGIDISALRVEKNSTSGTTKGYAITPCFEYDGDVILSFKYINTTVNNSKVKLSVTKGVSFDGYDNPHSFDITNHYNNGWKTATYRITNATSTTRVKFALDSDNYFAIDDVVVTKDILSENADNQYYIAAHEGNATDVQTTRTLIGGIWNTLCLPFNVTKETMEAALGKNQDIQMRTFSSYADNVMTFDAVADDAVITAGTPFLIKLNTTFTNPTFNSVTVSNSTAAQTVTRGDVSFIGTYSKKELATDGTELFITTSGGLAIPTTNGNVMNGMRAYIKVPESMKFTPNGVRLAIDNETTSIQSVTTTSQPDAVYNLSGQRLQQPRKGLNIVRKNRKLIFIR